jgi:hypothetical protein
LVSFGRIYSYLEELGYNTEREYIRIEGWLVQFVPASESLQEEAVAKADRVAFAGEYTSIFSSEHLAAELLRSGRLKDHTRSFTFCGARKKLTEFSRSLSEK